MSSRFRRKKRTRSIFPHAKHGLLDPSRTSLRTKMLYVIISFLTVFVFTSLLAQVQSHWHVSSNTLKKWTTPMSLETFVATLGMELPQFRTYTKSAGIEVPQASTVMLEMVTSFNPEDPRTLIRREIPGFVYFDGEIVSAGEGVNYTDIPIESSPPLEVVMAEREAVAEELTEKEEEQDTTDSEEDQQEPELSTEGRKVVYIYHTHNRESYLPHLPSATSADEAYHAEINITKVGQRLGEELEKRGIGTYVDMTDITQRLNDAGLQFADSYQESREVVEAAMAEQKDVTFMFDLHRDSVGKDKTTIEIDGKKYARTAIVIGRKNPHYESNLAFAEKLEAKMEEAYPGLNRMIYMPDKGNGEYNQSLSENNLLIEIGGVENTLEESYRTAEALADVIADLYWEAEKVDAPAK